MLTVDWPDVLPAPSPPPGARSDVRMTSGAFVDRGADPGHLVTPDEWAAVVAEAEAIAAGAARPRYGLGAGTGVDGVVTARYNGGRMTGRPTFVVIHDAETPLVDSYVQAIAGYFQRGPAAGTSAHHMVGPRTWLQLLPEDVVAYAAGPKANPRGIHVEQTGYARFTRAQWTSQDGLAQVARMADCVRAACLRWGIPMRWCTDQQLRDAAAGRALGGLTTHAQVTRVLGGTTHTDPAPNYPGDLLLAALLSGGNDMAGVPDDVNLSQQRDLIYDALWPEPRTGSPFRHRGELLQLARDTEKRTAALAARIGDGPDNGLADLWNRGGVILGAIAGLSGQLDALTDQLAAIRSAGGAGGPSAEQIAAAVVRLQDQAARDGDASTGPTS